MGRLPSGSEYSLQGRVRALSGANPSIHSAALVSLRMPLLILFDKLQYLSTQDLSISIYLSGPLLLKSSKLFFSQYLRSSLETSGSL